MKVWQDGQEAWKSKFMDWIRRFKRLKMEGPFIKKMDSQKVQNWQFLQTTQRRRS